MIPEKFSRSLARNPDKSAFEFSLALTQESGETRLAYALLEFVRTDLQELVPLNQIDYGVLRIQRTHLKLDEGRRFLDELYGAQTISLEQLARFAPFSPQTQSAVFTPSKTQYGTFSRPWPFYLSEWVVDNKMRANAYQTVLARTKLPLYPTSSEAIRDFFGIGNGQYWNFNDYGKLAIVVPDYRARIEELKIGYGQISMTATVGDIKPDSLRFKVYADDQTRSSTSGDLHLKDGVAEYRISFDPARILSVLLDEGDESMIDMRDWRPGFANATGVTVERPEQQIRDLIAGGEGKRIEFKGSLSNRDDFIETVLAFSNTAGGLILVGIADNRVPLGFKGDRDAIVKTIKDSCEPTVEPRFKEYELDGYPILAIEVSVGSDKPYVMKNRGVVYVRIGPNDVPASRLDLDQLYQNRGNPNQPFGGRLNSVI